MVTNNHDSCRKEVTNMGHIIDVEFGAFTPEEERLSVLRKLGLQPDVPQNNTESTCTDSDANSVSFSGKLHSILL